MLSCHVPPLKRKLYIFLGPKSIGVMASKSDQVSDLMLVGPSEAGKTTAMLLLYHTMVDYRRDLNIDRLVPISRAPKNIFDEAGKFVRLGISPEPTDPKLKDIKFELTVKFKSTISVFGKTVFGKTVRIIFADMAGAITEALMDSFPELISQPPSKTQKILRDRGLSEEDIQYVTARVFRSLGYILVVKATDIGSERDPDGKFMQFLNNFALFKQKHKLPGLKGVAVLITHMDKAPQLMEKASKLSLSEFARTHLPLTASFLDSSGLVEKAKAIFHSAIYGEYRDEKGKIRFSVNPLTNRIDYEVDTYKELTMWLRETF
jgi:hypothetical protein